MSWNNYTEIIELNYTKSYGENTTSSYAFNLEITTPYLEFIPYAEWKGFVAGCIFYSVGLAGLIGNIIVYPPILLDKKLRKLPPYILIISLGISDTIATTGHGIYAGTNAIIRDRMGNLEFQMFIGAALEVAWFSMNYHLFIATFNRYICVVQPKYKATIFSRRNTLIFCTVCWVLAFGMILWLLPGGAYMKWDIPGVWFAYSGPLEDTYNMFNLVINAMVTIVLIACYIRVLFRIRESRRAVAAGRADQKISRTEMIITLQFGMIFVVYLIPGLFFPVFPFISGDTFWLGVLGEVTHMGVASVDPWIYLVVNKSLRKACLRFWGCKSATVDVEETTKQTTKPTTRAEFN